MAWFHYPKGVLMSYPVMSFLFNIYALTCVYFAKTYSFMLDCLASFRRCRSKAFHLLFMELGDDLVDKNLTISYIFSH